MDAISKKEKLTFLLSATDINFLLSAKDFNFLLVWGGRAGQGAAFPTGRYTKSSFWWFWLILTSKWPRSLGWTLSRWWSEMWGVESKVESEVKSKGEGKVAAVWSEDLLSQYEFLSWPDCKVWRRGKYLLLILKKKLLQAKTGTISWLH